MPNVAAEVRAGTFCYAAGEALDERTERSLLDLFGLLGELVPVEERLMDAATAISGCGPAFFALVVESLVDAGVKEGLTRARPRSLALTTMAGTAELLRKRGGDAVALRRAVTSPGGVTAAGLAALEDYGVRAAFGAAVEAVVRKAEAAQHRREVSRMSAVLAAIGRAGDRRLRRRAVPRLPDPDLRPDPAELDPAHPVQPVLSAVIGFIHDVTDPYLRLFRRILPPVGGGGFALDLSPIIAIIVLFIARGIVVGAIDPG